MQPNIFHSPPSCIITIHTQHLLNHVPSLLLAPIYCRPRWAKPGSQREQWTHFTVASPSHKNVTARSSVLTDHHCALLETLIIESNNPLCDSSGQSSDWLVMIEIQLLDTGIAPYSMSMSGLTRGGLHPSSSLALSSFTCLSKLPFFNSNQSIRALSKKIFDLSWLRTVLKSVSYVFALWLVLMAEMSVRCQPVTRASSATIVTLSALSGKVENTWGHVNDRNRGFVCVCTILNFHSFANGFNSLLPSVHIWQH